MLPKKNNSNSKIEGDNRPNLNKQISFMVNREIERARAAFN